MKVGFFDSGIGGLSVLHDALEHIPAASFIYYADKAHVPYGEKTGDQILDYVDSTVRFMIEKEVDAIVIACNTATSVAVDIMRDRYNVPIIGMEPAVKKAIDLYGDKKVLVAATPVTVKGKKMHELIEKVDKGHLVELVPLPKLVHFAENNTFDVDIVAPYLKEACKDIDFSEYSSVVLGCTHFNYFKDSFRSFLPEHVRFVDGVEGTISQLLRKIEESEIIEVAEASIDNKYGSKVEYYNSGVRMETNDELQIISNLLNRLDNMSKIV